MNKQAARVEEALAIVRSEMYKKAHDIMLAIEEHTAEATVTINASELEILRQLVSSKIGEEHKTWYDITHDESVSVLDMAYELAASDLREDRLHRLLGKLRS